SSGRINKRSASSGLMPSNVTETYIIGMATSGLASFGIIWYAVKPAISRNTNNSSVARLRSSAARINVSILKLLRFYRIYRIASGYKTRPHGDDFQLIGKTIDPHTGGVKTQN